MKRPVSPSDIDANPVRPTKTSRNDPKDIRPPGPRQRAKEEHTLASRLSRWQLDDLPGGEVFYIPEFIDTSTSKEWYSELNGLPTWYHPILKVYGKSVSQSRSIAAYASSEDITHKYSGHQVTMHYTYPEILTEIQMMVEDKLGVRFNHVMLNRYANGTEYIGKHRDSKQNKVIASMSLGAERTFILSPNKNCPGNPKNQSISLKNGSLLIMDGDTQNNWKHEIPKEPKVKDGRISLTFRQLDVE